MGKFVITEEEKKHIKSLYEQQRKTIKVKITKVWNPTYWYKPLVGKEIMVQDLGRGDFDKDYLVLPSEVEKFVPNADKEMDRYINKVDCQVVG